MYSKQRRQVEAQVHHLDQREQPARQPATRDRHLEFWMERCRRSNRLMRYRLDRSGASALPTCSVRCSCWNRNLYGSNKAISASRKRLDKTRARRGISQRLPHFVDGSIQAVVEVDKSIGGP